LSPKVSLRVFDVMAQLESMGYVSCPASFTSALVMDKSASRHAEKRDKRILAIISVMVDTVNVPVLNAHQRKKGRVISNLSFEFWFGFVTSFALLRG
jgi:thiamine biosynthesis protein ThiC